MKISGISGNKAVTAGILVLLFSAGFLRAYFSLSQTPFANGWDAYYYLVQIKAIIDQGRMHSPDYSLVYPLLLFAKLFIRDYVLAYKCTAAIISAMYVIALFFAGYNLSGSKKLLSGLIVASMGLLSPTAIFIDSQFLKNFLGIVFLIFFIGALPRGKWYVILLLFGATLLTHRLTGVLALIFLLLHFANRRYWKYLLACVVVAAGLSFFVPGILNVFDVGRFSNEFQKFPQFAPLSFFEFYSYEKTGWIWIIEFFLAGLIWLLWIFKECFAFRIGTNKRIKIAFWILTILLLFPFFIFNAEGPALRFFLTFMVLSPLVFSFIAEKANKIVLVVLIILFAAGSFISRKAYDPAAFDPPYKNYEGITKRAIKLIDRNKIKLVIVHKALAEYFTFTASLDAMPWQPEENLDKSTVMRISCGIEKWEFMDILDSTDMQPVKKVGINYFLLPETVWEKFSDKAIVSGDSLKINKIHSWENPWQVRPAFITRSRK